MKTFLEFLTKYFDLCCCKLKIHEFDLEVENRKNPRGFARCKICNKLEYFD